VVSPGDEEDLRGLLGLAKHFAETSAVKGLAEARQELGAAGAVGVQVGVHGPGVHGHRLAL